MTIVGSTMIDYFSVGCSFVGYSSVDMTMVDTTMIDMTMVDTNNNHALDYYKQTLVLNTSIVN